MTTPQALINFHQRASVEASHNCRSAVLVTGAGLLVTGAFGLGFPTPFNVFSGTSVIGLCSYAWHKEREAINAVQTAKEWQKDIDIKNAVRGVTAPPGCVNNNDE